MRHRGVGAAGMRGLWTTSVSGGALNLMRHCAVARAAGADAVMATKSGEDTYGPFGVGNLPFVAWSQRRDDDACILPEIYTRLADAIEGEVVVYIQGFLWLRRDFDHGRGNVHLWTCSPLLIEHCRRVLPGKEPALVPPIVDPRSFPYIPQESREAGRLAALPRKNGMAFIDAVYDRYRGHGGSYWTLDLIDGVPFTEFAARYRAPQALLTASGVEGCGLPGMEAMAAGMVVAGMDGGGASFYMRDGETALVANTPDTAAAALRAIEDPALRHRLSQTAYDDIQRFFPDAEPKRFWESFLREHA